MKMGKLTVFSNLINKMHLIMVITLEIVDFSMMMGTTTLMAIMEITILPVEETQAASMDNLEHYSIDQPSKDSFMDWEKQHFLEISTLIIQILIEISMVLLLVSITYPLIHHWPTPTLLMLSLEILHLKSMGNHNHTPLLPSQTTNFNFE